MNKHFGRVLILGLLAIGMPAAFGQVFVSVRLAPPILPVYAQPIAPAPGYLWTPGYWAYGPDGYYWVPGTWVLPPSAGLLWTPGYWGFEGGAYLWHGGYWGPHVGYYGGVNYGFGYTGVGFLGGMWVGSVFRYNTAVMHVGPGFRETYVDRRAIVEGGARYSFNGPGGWSNRPTAGERLAERDHHIERTEMQRSHEHTASLDRSARFSENHGRPSSGGFNRPREASPANRGPVTHGAPSRVGESRAPAGHAVPESRGGGQHTPAPRGESRGPAAGHSAPTNRGGEHTPARGGRGGEKGEHHND